MSRSISENPLDFEITGVDLFFLSHKYNERPKYLQDGLRNEKTTDTSATSKDESVQHRVEETDNSATKTTQSNDQFVVSAGRS